MPPTSRSSPLVRWMERPWFLTFWCVAAAFGTYACMYGFRKPFTAAGFGGPEAKAFLVTAQVIGYLLSKVIGIKVISEMPPHRRALTLLGLIGTAQAALVLFALTPGPWHAAWLFANGLCLGMVFGLVLGFLEGRCLTELFVAGLCASFILADGFAKSVGSWLLASGVPDHWMPCAAGMVFALPLLAFVWMLRQIPPPTARDVAARSPRQPMSGAERLGLLRRHGIGLAGILLAYLLITVLRSIRADFAPEIWDGLGLGGQPAIFTQSELWVALGIVAANGALVMVKDNRRAFLLSLLISAGGLLLGLAALAGLRSGGIPPFVFMVLLGFGLYLPYVAVHTTVFERLIAFTRERGNIGYLMYLADAIGYLGYVVVMLLRGAFPSRGDFLGFFLPLAGWLLLASLVSMACAWVFYAWRSRRGGGSA